MAKLITVVAEVEDEKQFVAILSAALEQMELFELETINVEHEGGARLIMCNTVISLPVLKDDIVG